MPYRSPGRYLAPLALIVAVTMIYLVVRPQLGDSSGSPSKPASTTVAKKAGAPKSRTGKAQATAKAPKTYTVKPGDVLGSISQATGVPVADLVAFNDLEDAQSLSVGQKLKLGP